MEIYSGCIFIYMNIVYGNFGVRVIDLNIELLEVRNLIILFRIEDDYYVVVDYVNFMVKKNEVLVIVGELGLGKSVFVFLIMGFYNKVKIDGQILYKGQDIVNIFFNKLNKFCGKEMGMIFQDFFFVLNFLMIIGDQIDEILILY